MMKMFVKAAEAAGSNDVAAVAAELEKTSIDTPTGTIDMRADNHQALVPLVVSMLTSEAESDVENTGLGWKTLATISGADLKLDTTCNMQRP
jgi:branched-chain amino acid transport system substrate-binding protein